MLIYLLRIQNKGDDVKLLSFIRFWKNIIQTNPHTKKNQLTLVWLHSTSKVDKLFKCESNINFNLFIQEKM